MESKKTVYDSALEKVVGRIRQKGYIESTEAERVLDETIMGAIGALGVKPSGYDGPILSDELYSASRNEFFSRLAKSPEVKTKPFPKDEFEFSAGSDVVAIYAADEKQLENGYAATYQKHREEEQKLVDQIHKNGKKVASDF